MKIPIATSDVKALHQMSVQLSLSPLGPDFGFSTVDFFLLLFVAFDAFLERSIFLLFFAALEGFVSDVLATSSRLIPETIEYAALSAADICDMPQPQRQSFNCVTNDRKHVVCAIN